MPCSRSQNTRAFSEFVESAWGKARIAWLVRIMNHRVLEVIAAEGGAGEPENFCGVTVNCLPR
jgi:hypothetical protein